MVAQVDVGNHVQGGGDSEPLVKALFDRAIGEGLVKDRLATFIAGPLDAEMPFPDHGSLVSSGLEIAGDCRPVVFNERFVAGREKHPALKARTPAVATGEQAIAGRGADGGAAMSVEETGAGTSEAIKVRSRDFRFWVENTHVPVSHVIGEDDHDIWFVGSCGGTKCENEGEER